MLTSWWFMSLCVMVALVSLLFPSLLPSSSAPPPLLQAAYHGDLQRLRALLAQHRNRSSAAPHPSINDIRDQWNNTAVHVSIPLSLYFQPNPSSPQLSRVD